MVTNRPPRQRLSWIAAVLGGLVIAVLLIRFVVGIDGLVQTTALDGLDYLEPWWLAVLVWPAGLLCFAVGRRGIGATLLVLFCTLLSLDDDWRWHRAGTVPPQSQSLTVLALNASHYEAGLARVVRGIKSLNPDVVLLSENCLSGDREEELRAAFAPYTLVSSRSDDMAIASRLPILSAKEIDLPSIEPSRRCLKPGTEEAARPNRAFMHARVKFHHTVVNVISVRFIGGRAPSSAHLDEVAWGHYLLATQRDERRFLLGYLSRVQGPIVFGGDLNATPTAGLIRGLDTVASDAYLASHWVGLPTFPVRFPVERLDYLFSMHGVLATYAVRPDLHVSDHYPVLARFHVESAAANRARVAAATRTKTSKAS
jgi:endonuclease/exonuclease/phosphatase (EEP) superfamily protein YafD